MHVISLCIYASLCIYVLSWVYVFMWLCTPDNCRCFISWHIETSDLALPNESTWQVVSPTFIGIHGTKFGEAKTNWWTNVRLINKVWPRASWWDVMVVYGGVALAAQPFGVGGNFNFTCPHVNVMGNHSLNQTSRIPKGPSCQMFVYPQWLLLIPKKCNLEPMVNQ